MELTNTFYFTTLQAYKMINCNSAEMTEIGVERVSPRILVVIRVRVLIGAGDRCFYPHAATETNTHQGLL